MTLSSDLSAKKKSNSKDIIEYILIIALYYVTGGAFSYFNYSMQIIVFFLVSLFICIKFGGKKYALRSSAVVPLTLMSFFIIIVPIFFNDSISTYIAIIMQLAIGLFCASVISPESFKQKFINVITFFAGVSLIGFAVGMVMPGVALLFPVSTVEDSSVYYYNAGIYVFMSPKGYASFLLTDRNAGICWEPGCYQAFLNIGLLFLLNQQEKQHQKYFFYKFTILIITVVTTVSTTGLIILLLLLIFYFPVWGKGLKLSWVLLPFLFLLIVWLYDSTSLGGILQDKLSAEFGETNSFLDRISLNKISYFFDSNTGLPYFFGMSFSKWLTYDTEIWNSVIHSLLCLGTPFTLIHLIGYWKGSNLLVRKTGLLFIVMIMCASTETFFWRVFFNTFAFYGWIGNREYVEDTISKKTLIIK